MEKEQYVSYETAKLLKEKGFDEATSTAYLCCDGRIWDKRFIKMSDDIYQNVWYDAEDTVMFGNLLLAPTQQMAMRWLREEKHYYIQIMLDSWALDTHLGYYIVIQDILSDFEEINPVDKVFFKTYEEAVEAAIMYCLENLIK